METQNDLKEGRPQPEEGFRDSTAGTEGLLGRPPAAPRECPHMAKILSRMGALRRPLGTAALSAWLLAAWTAPARAAGTLEALNVYPNPVRQYAGQSEVVFDNLTQDVEIKIYDADGGLVKEFTSQAVGNTFRWDMTDDAGVRVASGIYIYVVQNKAGENKLGKVAIIR